MLSVTGVSPDLPTFRSLTRSIAHARSWGSYCGAFSGNRSSFPSAAAPSIAIASVDLAPLSSVGALPSTIAFAQFRSLWKNCSEISWTALACSLTASLFRTKVRLLRPTHSSDGSRSERYASLLHSQRDSSRGRSRGCLQSSDYLDNRFAGRPRILLIEGLRVCTASYLVTATSNFFHQGKSIFDISLFPSMRQAT